MTAHTSQPQTDVALGALAGLKVLELAHVIAGPLAGTLMADLGADVVHVEDPVTGDSLRDSGPKRNGIGLWWKVSARNKRSVTLDLRTLEGQDLARRLTAWADVVISNFRPGRLEAWGLGFEDLHRVNPKVIMLQISGHGLNTSQRDEPGFGKAAEARSGVAEITGDPDGRPIFAGFSHADSLTALMGAMSVQAALYRRAVDSDFDGEHIDLALSDTLLRLIEWQVIVNDQLGMTPTRAGNRMEISPAAIVDTYLTKDDRWLMITSATPRSVQNIATLVGHPREDYATSDQRDVKGGLLSDALAEWVSRHTLEEALAETKRLEVVASPVLSVADIVQDATFAERGLIVEVDDEDLGPVRMQAVVPRLARHPGRIWRAGPQKGQDNELVYRTYLGMSQDDYADLAARGVI